jgi:hypothetical protein
MAAVRSNADVREASVRRMVSVPFHVSGGGSAAKADPFQIELLLEAVFDRGRLAASWNYH